MRIRKIAMRAFVIAMMLCAASASADQTISWNYYGDPHWIHIQDPDVRHAQTFLPIVVHRNNLVWIRAGGCVQTGGAGATWKRYVNPSGPNAFRLYHGQIQIPGAVESLTNLDQLVGGDGGWSRMFTVGANNPNFAPGLISIGYTDDNYGDNGYWGHDNGTENQCNGVGDAWLEIYMY